MKNKPTENYTAAEFQELIKKTKHLTAKQKQLINEFENYLAERFYEIKKEVPYSKIFPNCKRKFRCDYFVKQVLITTTEYAIIEINGGQFTGGRHNRGGKGYEGDLMKSNIANKNKTPYYQFTYEQLSRGEYEQFL